jgi:hypothetical protein
MAGWQNNNYNTVGSGASDARGFSSVSTNSRIAQNFLIGEQLFVVQRLYSLGFLKRIPEAVRALFLLTANFHDPQFKAEVDLIKKNTWRRADKLFSLKPSDIRMRNDNYWRRMEWIRQEFAEALLTELIVLFQRKNIVAKKSYVDSELDVDILENSPDFV